jgi:hypothetical protein
MWYYRPISTSDTGGKSDGRVYKMSQELDIVLTELKNIGTALKDVDSRLKALSLRLRNLTDHVENSIKLKPDTDDIPALFDGG